MTNTTKEGKGLFWFSLRVSSTVVVSFGARGLRQLLMHQEAER